MGTCGEALIKLLEAYGVDRVFGIPGIHTVEFYRGLPNTGIKHITPRHEQGAGFMADGYARATGKPGVILVITGPGLTNAITAIATAYSDSIPMLVLSSVNRTGELGMGEGFLHELPSQRNLTSAFTAFSHTVLTVDELPKVLARAFAVFYGSRPRPVHIEIPVDVLSSKANIPLTTWAYPTRPGPDPRVINKAAAILKLAQNPVVIFGGGTVDATEEAFELVERLDTPTVLTVAARGVLSEEHPLCLGANLPFKPVQDMIKQADVVLAVGTELAVPDLMPSEGPLEIKGKLIRIDVDPEQLARNNRPDIAILSDAGPALAELCKALNTGGRDYTPGETPGAKRVAAMRFEIKKQWGPATQKHKRLLDALREVLPDDGVIATDTTQLVYSGSYCFPIRRPRTWLTPMGYSPLGYALPAAIGAKIAKPDRPVVCLIGDGGIQFTLPELVTAVEQKIPLAVVIWNNEGYGEIRDYMDARDIPQIGVNLHTPDFLTIAKGFGCKAERSTSLDHFKKLIKFSDTGNVPTVIEVREDATFLAS